MPSNTLKQCFNLKHNFQALYQRPAHRNQALDGIRGLSIIMVVFFHSFYMLSGLMDEAAFRLFNTNPSMLLTWISRGDYGVDAFFALSGFLIGCLLMSEHQQHGKIKIKQFYIRRLMRLYPAFLFIIMVCAIGLTASNKSMGTLWATSLYVINFIPYDERIIKWSWSLAVEEQFYLLFPLLLIIGLRWFKQPLIWLGALFLLSFVVRYVVLIQAPELFTVDIYHLVFEAYESFNPVFAEQMYGNLHTRYGAIFAGVLAAYLHTYHSATLNKHLKENSRLNNSLLILSLMAITGLLSIPLFDPDFLSQQSSAFNLIMQTSHRGFFGLAVATLILCVTYPNSLSSLSNKILSTNILFPFAQLSYSMYLIHLPIVFIFSKLFYASFYSYSSSYPLLLILPTAITCTLISALLSALIFILIEKPFLNMR